MEADILAWSVPSTFASFSIVFALLGRFGPSLKIWSGCFGLAALGFALTVIPSEEGSRLKPLLENLIFLLALAGVNAAFAIRANRRPSPVSLALVVCAAMAGAAFSLYVLDNAHWQIFWIQSGCAVLMLLAAFDMRADLRRPIDHVLFWVCVTVAANLTLQNILFVALPSETITVANWRSTSWGFVFQLSGVLTGILVAFSVLIATGLDVIGSLSETSDADALTQVLNRRGFERQATELRSRFGQAQPCGLVLADLDFFKQINDRHGHDAGDAALCGFATLLGSLTGTRGYVARLGGEEFAVVLGSADLNATQAFALRVQGALARISWPSALHGTNLTASFGVIELRANETLWDGVKRADGLLYAAKSHGRNQVVSDPLDAARASRTVERTAGGLARAR